MDKSPPKDKESQPVSVQVRQKSAQPEKKNGQHSLYMELAKIHPHVKRAFLHQKFESFKRTLQENQRLRNIKLLRGNSRNFIERCLPQHLQALTEMTYRQYVLFLRNQKKIDDEKLKKLGKLVTDWQSKKNKADWKAPLNKFLERERTRYNKKSFK